MKLCTMLYILYTTKCCILKKKKLFTMARDDRNGKLLPPNGNEEGLQRSDQCPIFTPIAKGKLI